MKICFIDWFAYGIFNPKSKIVFGGAQIQLYFLAKELAKDKKYTVFFLTDNGKNNQAETFFKVKVFQFVRSQKTPGIFGRLLNLLYRIPVLGYLHFFFRLLIQLRKIDSGIYIQRAASAETGLIALICKILRRRFIFMIAHEQDINGTFVRQNGWRGKLFFLGLNMADKIICQTKEQQAFLTGRFKNKSVVISSGYPQKSLEKINSKKRGVLWVARAEEWKQPELFIKLVKKFPQEKFTMICPPAENNPGYFKIIAAQVQQTQNLKFIKYVPFQEIDAYFASAKIFVSTAISEGFPNTFIQAGQNKTPIISFKVNPDKIIDKYRIGFCAGSDERQMEKLLKKVLSNNQLRLQLGKNAYNYVRQHHDIKQTVVNIIANIV